MDSNCHNNLFAGSWSDFSLLYAQRALQYKSDYEFLLKEQALEHRIDQAFVLYYASTIQETILLHQFQNVLKEESFVIIICASYVKIHIFDSVSLRNMAVHLVLQQNASCIYEQEFISADIDSIKRQSIVTVHADATAEYNVLYAGESSIVHNYYSDAQGKDAHILFRGVFCAKRRQKIAIHSHQRHSCIGALSEVLVKGFATQESCVSYKGVIAIDHNAINTIARQKHETLLLGDKASVESIPILEVLNKEVQCSHASAIGMLDPHTLFYLQSRGLSQQKAAQLFLLSYVEVVYNSMPFGIKKKIEDLINSFHFL